LSLKLKQQTNKHSG